MDKTKIMVVENEGIVAHDIARQLTDMGYEVAAIAYSGEKAVEKARELHIDLVLMDIALDMQMDGIEAADIIRSHCDIPVIFLTAYADRKLLERAKLAYPFGYILKPFQSTDLMAAVEIALYTARVVKEQILSRENADRLAEETEIVAKIGCVIGSTLDIEEVYEKFATEVRKLIPFDRIAVNLCNIPENTLVVAYVSGTDISNRGKGDTSSLEGTLTNEILHRRTGLMIQPESPDSIDEIVSRIPELLPTFEAGLRSLLDVPLVYKDEAIGVLQFRSKAPNAYTEQDLSRAERIGVQIAGAIGNAKLFAHLQKMENSLRDSESRFRTLVEQAAVGVAEIDMNTGRFIMVNRRLCEMFGRTEEELMATTFLAITHPEDLHLHEEKKALLAVRKIGHYSIEKRYLRKDGKSVWVNITISPLWKSGEKPGYNMAMVEDITDRRRAEEEKQVISERLQRADKMEAIGTLAGGIAHDFNNLLLGIQGGASLMLLDLDPSHPHYERLKLIEEQVQSGAELTKQLLGFARGGRYEVKPTDMNDIIKKTSSMFGRTKKEITIHRKYGKDLRTIEVDRGQMEQVFMNLYVNAWQAMPGGGEIYLETENVLLSDTQTIYHAMSPGQYVKISVTDTGTGMDEKTRQRIFEPFFTTKGMGRGTGLGLATVYGIIKGHKGMIHVDSKPGHGTTFDIYLPASEKEVVVEERRRPETIAKGTETILFVDDEKMVLEVTRELLESRGYRVYAAGSGQEAIAVYLEKRNEIDLVILDMILPGISGGETFDRLREINPGIKVLLSSGYSIEGQAQEILDRGCNGFIQKPFRLGILSGKVREILD